MWCEVLVYLCLRSSTLLLLLRLFAAVAAAAAAGGGVAAPVSRISAARPGCLHDAQYSMQCHCSIVMSNESHFFQRPV